ncbi:hypothetical protein ACFL38_02250 [Candidatus Omnitrophota bacterium]
MKKTLLTIIALLLVASVGYCQEGWELTRQYSKLGLKMLPVLRDKLKTGTPEEKEEVLYIFMELHIVELIPQVIESILDDTVSPRHDDTGWGNVYHQAATAMCKFAYKIDGISQKERGYEKFSFSSDVGTATEQRRKEVYNNWLKWWKNNQVKILASPKVKEQFSKKE